MMVITKVTSFQFLRGRTDASGAQVLQK